MADITTNQKNLLSSDVEIKGSIKFQNELTVDGKIEGEINSPGVLTVGENSEIKGEIKTKSVTVYGKVHGNITVEERCELKGRAVLYGGMLIAAGHFASHDTTAHAYGEYVRGEAHTNTVEGFFSILKRGLYGTYQCVSVAHLHRYLNEFDYRYSTLGFQDSANLDDGNIWPTSYALKKWTAAVEKQVATLVKTAIS